MHQKSSFRRPRSKARESLLDLIGHLSPKQEPWKKIGLRKKPGRPRKFTWTIDRIRTEATDLLQWMGSAGCMLFEKRKLWAMHAQPWEEKLIQRLRREGYLRVFQKKGRRLATLTTKAINYLVELNRDD